MVDSSQIEKLFEAARLSSTEREVLVFLINHLDEVERMGVRRIAEACFTSPTTVIRLSKKLNYQGFKEMVYELKRFARPTMTSISASAGPDYSCNEDAIKAFRRAFVNPGSICLYGEGWSSMVTEYMEKKLIISGKQVVSHSYLGTNTLLKQIPNLSSGIFVSKGGSTTAVTEAARRCKHAGITTISFTGNPRGKLAQYSDALFTVQDDCPFDTENRGLNLFFARCISSFEQLLAKAITPGDTPPPLRQP